ncbi:hypothetical protein LAZ67_X003468 [Cordylochernes scorpioides]|uniref:Mos1 transposase HTH domain-containing protein n=1 Tax=Cordylochernes scorpioides TaxID=51811 RepID=A0ABY6LU45_9ARAC|nr:hypothetical protein LAZ67_X003468 [Cordylochernes scorpioides]
MQGEFPRSTCDMKRKTFLQWISKVNKGYAYIFRQKLGKIESEVFQMLKLAFGEATLSQSKTSKWFARFKSGRKSTQDDARQGRPPLENHEELIEKIGALIRENTITTIRELVEETGVSYGTFLDLKEGFRNLFRKKARMSNSKTKVLLVIFFRLPRHCALAKINQHVYLSIYAVYRINTEKTTGKVDLGRIDASSRCFMSKKSFFRVCFFD